MKLGCHAVLFTDRISADTDTVLKGLRDAGSEGVEIGSRFFGKEENQFLKEALDKQSMVLSGLHVGFKLTDLLEPAGIKSLKNSLANASEFLQIMPYKNIILTGMINPEFADSPDLGDQRLVDVRCLQKIAQSLNELVVDVKKDFHVDVNYHNHSWELRNDSLIYNSLIEYAPELCFALDIGWAAVAGRELSSLISELGKRLNYVHLRDFKYEDAKKNSSHIAQQEIYTDLGQGDLNYKQLLPIIEEALGEDGWAVIEYEKGEISFDRYAKGINYIKALSAVHKEGSICRT